jgi:hypothetical protein
MSALCNRRILAHFRLYSWKRRETNRDLSGGFFMAKVSKNRGTKTIIRKRKNKDNPYVTINKSVFEKQPHISLEAKGLMGIFLCKPDNWKVIMEEIIKESKNGRDAHYKALKELRQHGFVVLVEFRIKGRVEQKEYVVCEDPIHNPYWDKPLIIKVNNREEIDEWDDEDIESIIASQENKEVPPDPDFQEQVKKTVPPYPENPDLVKPDEVKPDEVDPTLLNNHLTDETLDGENQQPTLKNASVVVEYQTIIKNCFGKKLSIKHIERLMEIATKEKKSLEWAIENTHNYHTKVEPFKNLYGAIKHALESDGWMIPDNKSTSPAEILPESLRAQAEQEGNIDLSDLLGKQLSIKQTLLQMECRKEFPDENKIKTLQEEIVEIKDKLHQPA